MDGPLDYEQLRALQAVIRYGGFERAAQVLHVTQSAVSQRIRLLEEQAGGPVLIRSQPPKTTPLGRELVSHLESVMKLEGELRQQLGVDVPESRRTLAIGVNADSLSTWFLDAIKEAVLAENILLSVLVENEDLTQTLMQRGEVIGCVTSTSKPLTGCEAVYLGPMRYRCVAAPKFVRKYFPSGLTAESIGRAPAVLFNHHDRIHFRFLQNVFPRRDLEFPFHLVPSSEGFARMVELGLAYGLVPAPQTDPLIKKKKLIALRHDADVLVKLYWHHARNEREIDRKVRMDLVSKTKEYLRQHEE